MKRLFALLLSVMILLPAAAALAADPVPAQAVLLDITEANVPLNRRITLRAVVDPRNASNKKLDWTSSDQNIVKVNNGTVSGVGLGTAVVTASATDGSGVSASAVITVVNPVTKIIPEEKQLTLPAGVTWEMYWSVEPKDATYRDVIWTSTDEKIATVNENGVIFTHQNGYCSINGSTVDGSGVKTVVNLTVRDHEILILKPGEVDVSFETEDTTITETKTVNGKETTVKTTRHFATDKGCVISPEDMVLLPVKAGSDTVSIQFIQKKKTTRIDKHTVFVARSAVGEAATFTEDGAAKPIRFLSLPWGSSYPKVREIMNHRGRNVKSIAQNNDNLRSMVDGEVLFGNLRAFSAALNFTYDHGNRKYEVNNSLFSGDLYFDPSIPFDDVKKAVKSVYSLEAGEESDGSCSWERDHIRVVLTQKERFTQLELIWDGEPLPQDEEDEYQESWDEAETDDGFEGPEDSEAAEAAMPEPGAESPLNESPEGPWAEGSGYDGPEGPWADN